MVKLNTGKLGKSGEKPEALTPKEFIFNGLAEAAEKGEVAPVVPIIGQHFVNSLAFEEQIEKSAILDLIETYGSLIEHPAFREEAESGAEGQGEKDARETERSGHTITSLSQYRSVKLGGQASLETIPGEIVKKEYLDILKKILFHYLNEGLINISSEKMVELLFNESKLNFSQLCAFLDWPRLNKDHPLMRLARLNIAVFITTSYHALLERALWQAGKKPVVEICRWREDLSLQTVLERYQPDLERPLVFHLHGFDSIPASLVLTEDDHLDLLASIEGVLPARVAAALEKSSLVVMGYRLQDWDFKVLFRGIVKSHRKRPVASVAIQLDKKDEDKEYLELYLEQMQNFEVEWTDDPGLFIKEMSDRSEKR